MFLFISEDSELLKVKANKPRDKEAERSQRITRTSRFPELHLALLVMPFGAYGNEDQAIPITDNVVHSPFQRFLATCREVHGHPNSPINLLHLSFSFCFCTRICMCVYEYMFVFLEYWMLVPKWTATQWQRNREDKVAKFTLLLFFFFPYFIALSQSR